MSIRKSVMPLRPCCRWAACNSLPSCWSAKSFSNTLPLNCVTNQFSVHQPLDPWNLFHFLQRYLSFLITPLLKQTTTLHHHNFICITMRATPISCQALTLGSRPHYYIYISSSSTTTRITTTITTCDKEDIEHRDGIGLEYLLRVEGNQ
jgi:hypothetical protein